MRNGTRTDAISSSSDTFGEMYDDFFLFGIKNEDYRGMCDKSAFLGACLVQIRCQD